MSMHDFQLPGDKGTGAYDDSSTGHAPDTGLVKKQLVHVPRVSSLPRTATGRLDWSIYLGMKQKFKTLRSCNNYMNESHQRYLVSQAAVMPRVPTRVGSVRFWPIRRHIEARNPQERHRRPDEGGLCSTTPSLIHASYPQPRKPAA